MALSRSGACRIAADVGGLHCDTNTPRLLQKVRSGSVLFPCIRALECMFIYWYRFRSQVTNCNLGKNRTSPRRGVTALSRLKLRSKSGFAFFVVASCLDRISTSGQIQIVVRRPISLAFVSILFGAIMELDCRAFKFCNPSLHASK